MLWILDCKEITSEAVSRTHDPLEMLAGKMGIEAGRINAGMAEQNLNGE